MTTKITYNSSWIPETREQLLHKIERSMSPRRFQHVLGVEQTAIQLAERYGENVHMASLAALLHDYGKERPDSSYYTLIEKHHCDYLCAYGNNIWHGLLGVELIRHELEVKNDYVLHAVQVHTTGAPHMTLLDKIIFVADYIEPHRHFPGVETARLLAEQDLNAAVAFELKHTLLHLISENQPVYPLTLEAYNKWVAHI